MAKQTSTNPEVPEVPEVPALVTPEVKAVSKMELTYGDQYKHDFDALLATENGKRNLFVLATKQVAHKMSNEVDSTINSFVREKLGLPSSNPKGTSDREKAEIRDRITAWREANKSAVDAELKAARDEMWDTIVNGVIGLRAGGPRKDPVLAEFEKILGQEARKTFREQNYQTPPNAAGQSETAKFPTDDTTVVQFLVKGGDGQVATLSRTRPELIANYAKRHEARLMDKAREIVALRDAQTPVAPAQEDVGF